MQRNRVEDIEALVVDVKYVMAFCHNYAPVLIYETVAKVS